MLKSINLPLFMILMSAVAGRSQNVMPLYSHNIPNAKPSKEIAEKSETKDGILIISGVTEPTLTVFLPPAEKANGTAVVICPGGGYWILAAGHEGYDVAKKFNEFGVTAFVLKYRLPDERIMIKPEIGPLQDAQRAIQLVRERAKEWKVDPTRIGIMGFSAGGHLASTAGTHFGKTWIDNPKNTSLRPDFMILIYPVISADTTIWNKGSFIRLLGNNPSPEKLQEYSNELQVSKQTPPTFLVHASDDTGVSSENSVKFYLALNRNGIPAELHIYEKGKHGFGLNNTTTSDAWMDRCKNWMAGQGWLKK